MMAQGAYILFGNCGYPIIIVYYGLLNGIIMIGLFANFYLRNYVREAMNRSMAS